jgi:hypothetical protein
MSARSVSHDLEVHNSIADFEFTEVGRARLQISPTSVTLTANRLSCVSVNDLVERILDNPFRAEFLKARYDFADDFFIENRLHRHPTGLGEL